MLGAASACLVLGLAAAGGALLAAALALGLALAPTLGGKVVQDLADGVVEGVQGADQVLLWDRQRLADPVDRCGEADPGRLVGGDAVLGQGDQVGAAVGRVAGTVGVATAGHGE